MENEDSKKKIEMVDERVLARRDFIIVLTGMVSIIGFIMSIGLLLNKAVYTSLTGRVIGDSIGDIYGIIIIFLICLIGAIYSLVIFRKNQDRFSEK